MVSVIAKVEIELSDFDDDYIANYYHKHIAKNAFDAQEKRDIIIILEGFMNQLESNKNFVDARLIKILIERL